LDLCNGIVKEGIFLYVFCPALAAQVFGLAYQRQNLMQWT